MDLNVFVKDIKFVSYHGYTHTETGSITLNFVMPNKSQQVTLIKPLRREGDKWQCNWNTIQVQLKNEFGWSLSDLIMDKIAELIDANIPKPCQINT